MSATDRQGFEKTQSDQANRSSSRKVRQYRSTHVTFGTKYSIYYINPKEKGREKRHACLGRKMILEQRYIETKKDERNS